MYIYILLTHVQLAFHLCRSISAPQLGGIILGLQWSLNSVSGLTIATPCVQRFGYKISMIISFAGYTFQIATLYLAIISSDRVAWPVGIVGSVVSGNYINDTDNTCQHMRCSFVDWQGLRQQYGGLPKEFALREHVGKSNNFTHPMPSYCTTAKNPNPNQLFKKTCRSIEAV